MIQAARSKYGAYVVGPALREHHGEWYSDTGSEFFVVDGELIFEDLGLSKGEGPIDIKVVRK